MKTKLISTSRYSSNFTTSEIDARYPRAEWLQILLDRGIIIENFHEYVSYLSKRHTLALLEDDQGLRQSGILDIPPTDDWETYKASYIEKLVNDHTTLREAAEQIETVENAKAQIEEDAKRTIKSSKEAVERAKEQLDRAREHIERAQEVLERPEEPTPPQEPN